MHLVITYKERIENMHEFNNFPRLMLKNKGIDPNKMFTYWVDPATLSLHIKQDDNGTNATPEGSPRSSE